jgi:hypothetical protein
VRDDYVVKPEALRVERKTVETSKPQPVFVRQRPLIRTLVDDWQFLTMDERRALIADIFEEIGADEEGIEDFLPGELWKPLHACRRAGSVRKVPTERKTGLYACNVETLRLVRDERGWLGLAS